MYNLGKDHGTRECQAAYAQASTDFKAEAKVIETNEAKVGVEVGEAVAKTQASTRANTITLIKKVPIYVSTQDDLNCNVSPGFVSVYNLAVSNDPDRVSGTPDPTGQPDRAAASAGETVTLSQVAQTNVYNLGVCHLAIAQAEGWKSWYRGVKGDEN